MTLKADLLDELETTRQNFHHLLDSVPEAAYVHPSDNPAWTIGDVLYHITIGLPAVRVEIWMVRYTPWIFKGLNDTTSKIFNWVNALFARHPKRISRQGLIKAYEAGHAGLMSSLRRLREKDLEKSVNYPASFVAELAGVVTVERLVRYLITHFDIHAQEIKAALNAPSRSETSMER
jgi:hypothetical protein